MATVLAVVGNVWWVAAHRPGLPFDIDEAGYLQRAVRDSDALHAGGLSQLVHVVRQPDPQAPLVTVIAGLIRYSTGAGPYRLIDVEQLFVVILSVATYLAASQLVPRRWAALAAVVTLCLPGVIDGSRSFDFALPAAAMVIAALAAQLWAADFSSTPRALLWGLLLGLTALTRTMTLGLIAALLVAAGVHLVATRAGRYHLLNVGGGLVVGFAVALAWYSATWRNVAEYLSSYGYGARAAAYGPGRPVWSVQWWIDRLTKAAKTDILVSLVLALTACIVLGVVGVIVRWRAGWPRVVDQGARSELFGGRLAGAPITVAVFLIVSYLLLSSTRNLGSGFELPLIPAAVILIMAAASRAGPMAWPVAVTVCGVAAVFTFGATSGLFPASNSTTRSVSLGPFSMQVFDSRGPVVRQAQTFSGGCPSIARCLGLAPSTNAEYLAKWLPVTEVGARMIHDDAAARDRYPVVFFSVQDPLFNTNSVDLDYQLQFHQALPTGLLRPPSQAGVSLRAQLEAPDLGQPNLVIVGPASRIPAARGYSPLTETIRVRSALKADGFSQIGRLNLPDGRVMQLWWKEQGPAIPTAPSIPATPSPPVSPATTTSAAG